MALLMKNPVSATDKKVQPVIQETYKGPAFNVQANRTTSDTETYLKTKGAFKIRVQNKGSVGVKIFGNFDLPSYADETFEPGDSSLGFASDTYITYDPHLPTDVINIVTTAYTRA